MNERILNSKSFSSGPWKPAMKNLARASRETTFADQTVIAISDRYNKNHRAVGWKLKKKKANWKLMTKRRIKRAFDGGINNPFFYFFLLSSETIMTQSSAADDRIHDQWRPLTHRKRRRNICRIILNCCPNKIRLCHCPLIIMLACSRACTMQMKHVQITLNCEQQLEYKVWVFCKLGWRIDLFRLFLFVARI